MGQSRMPNIEAVKWSSAMRWLLIAGVGLLAALPASSGRAAPPAGTTFALLPVNKACACIKPLSSVDGLTWRDQAVGRRLFQVFSERKSGRELFRFEIGTRIDSTWVNWWNYGIAAKGDFNEDGFQDFSWYGGDDTSDAKYVLLSSPKGYRRVDIYASLAKAWKLRYRAKAPEFASVASEFSEEDVRIERSAGTMTLFATVRRSAVQPGRTYRVQIGEADFVFAGTGR